MKRQIFWIAAASLLSCAAPPARAPIVVARPTEVEPLPEAPVEVAQPPPAIAVAPVVAQGLPAPASSLASEGFTLLGEERGVKVYRRQELPGIELAAEGTIKGSPAQVRLVLTDYPGHFRWQKHLKEQKVMAKSESSLDVYERLGLPMIDDRDFTLHVTWGEEGEVLWMRFAALPSGGPAPVSDVVRVTAHNGSWRLEPADGGHATHAVYRFYLDLAGMFPSWLGAGQATTDLPDLFEAIARELPRYPSKK